MNTGLNTFLEILKYILPSLVIFGITYSLVKQFLDEGIKKQTLEIKKQSQNIINPLKLQAYERLVLLLERISPTSLLMHNNEPGCSATYLKIKIVHNINEEYNHNLSQQIYVSPQAWSIIKVVKEQVVDMIGHIYDTMPEGSTGIDFGKKMIEQMMEDKTQPTQKAIDFLKAEVQLYFG